MFLVFKRKEACEVRICDWSSDVCSSELQDHAVGERLCRVEKREALIDAAERQRHEIDDEADDDEPEMHRDHRRPRPAPPGDPRHHVIDCAEQGERQEGVGAEMRVTDGELGEMRDLIDRKSTRLNSSHLCAYRMPSYA